MREGELLQHIFAHNAALPASVLIPPGDDMAAVRVGAQTVLITTDQSADGVHFDLATTPLEMIGRKAITRKLSDVAAMAAVPVAAEVAACLPRGFGAQRAKRLFDAMRETAGRYGCPLVGGDVAMWDQRLILTVTILADPAGIDPVRRSGARTGDLVCITGAVGGSWDPRAPGRGAHLDFEPRLTIARQLAETLGPDLHSMLDLSDGLATDLGHICRQSRVAAEIDARRVPLREEAGRLAERDGKPAWLAGLTDGEDYELCFTVAPEAAAKLPGELGGVPISVIGRILDPASAGPRGPVWVIDPDGRRDSIAAKGWEHQG